ncbi:MAG: ankyrin repeat domain-containing protein, partial [Rickettsiaceae bacterium]|nr:ankyrin repeat domain-containing protein [Rickettsiaceae bacterium]
KTPLHIACGRENAEVAKLLISYGANVNLLDKYNWTPLHIACSHGHTEVAKLLISYGANVNLPNSNGGTPLHEACSNGHTKVVDFLIKHGANVNLPDNIGWTPLHIACGNGHAEVAKLLIEKYHVDVNLPNSNGGTPLSIACSHGHAEVVDFLIKHGANVHQADNNFWTPLHYACANGHTEVVKLLIEHGATSHLIGNISQRIPQHYIDAQQWCKNAFQETPEYGSLHLLSEEARNVIKTIVANKFIDNDYTAAQIERFFGNYNILDCYKAEIVENVRNSDVYIYKQQASKIAEYLSGEAEKEPNLGNIQLPPAEKLADNIIKYLKLHGVSSYHELADRTLNLNNCDYAKEEIQKAIADEVTKGAHLEEDLERSITGKNLKISYFNPIFLECIKENTEEKTIAQLLNELKEIGLYEFSDFLQLLSKPHIVNKISEFKQFENFDKMPDYKKILIASRFENPGNDFPAILTDEQSANLDDGLRWALSHPENFVLEKGFMNLSGDHHEVHPHGNV